MSGEALANGIEIDWLTGPILQKRTGMRFSVLFGHGFRKWGTPYLTRAFFSAVSATMADDILLIMAKREGRYIAGALNFIGGDTLFGRTGAALRTTDFCISRCVITKPSTLLLREALNAWKRVPKVVTRSLGATCPKRPTAPTGLLTQDSEMPSRAS